MRKASVHKITNDCYRVTFKPDGTAAVAEALVESGGRARSIKRSFEMTGNVPDGITSPLAVAAT